MSDEQVKFLTEFEEWKATKRVSRDDLSPEAFLIDRAKDQALDKLIKIDDLVEDYLSREDSTEDLQELLLEAGSLIYAVHSVLSE